MQGLSDLFSGFAALFAAGGVLWLLLLLAVALWSLIAERYWYFFFVYPQVQEIDQSAAYLLADLARVDA